jgi:hypothetical protein
MQRDRVLISREALRQGFLEVLAGQVLIGSLGGQADRYSGKVPQPMRI